MMDKLMSETCRAHKKWNKIESDIKLVFYSSKVPKFNTLIQVPIVLYVVIKLLKF